MNKKSGFTLVEVVIAAAVMVLFVGGGFTLYLQGQKTIAKGTWINNSTRDESLALRELAELAKASSYPSTVFSSVIKVNESATYRAKLPAGDGVVPTQKMPLDIVVFPACTEEFENTPGTLKWIILRLQRQNDYENYYNLDLAISGTRKYKTSAPNYISGNNSFAYSESIEIASQKTILRDIEAVTITREASKDKSVSSIKIDFTLSYPKSQSFKKVTTIKLPLNVLVN